MTSIAASERTLLCALAQQLGPDAPTLCEGWTVRDLVVHLLIREGHPAGIAVAVKPLGPLLDRTSEKLARRDFPALVQRLRHGPPVYSPFAVPKLGAMFNLLEFFVHHEDIRRAQAGWVPRSLESRTEDGIWRAGSRAGRALVVRSPVAVEAERSDTGERVVWKGGDDPVVLRGLPSELVLYAFGRQDHAVVEKDGKPEDVAALDGTKPVI